MINIAVMKRLSMSLIHENASNAFNAFVDNEVLPSLSATSVTSSSSASLLRSAQVMMIS